MYRILVINPGSTSTKLSVFEDELELVQKTISHVAEELKDFKRIMDQTEFRLVLIRRFLDDHHVDIGSLSAAVGRGGLLKPIPSGVYRVNGSMLEDLLTCRFGEHASNLGGILAHRIALEAGRNAFIVDPVVVDEMDDIARITGIPELARKSIYHALNQKSVAREVARKIGKPYEKCNFIVAHMGGGISVGAHRRGSVVDVNNALDGDGPFAPERAGGLPAGQLVALCFSGQYSLVEMKQKLVGRGGLVAYRGSNNFADLKKAVMLGDEKAQLLYEAMAYRVSKEIAMHGATLKGDVDRIILTGGLAGDETFMEKIKERIGFLAPVEVMPGEREMTSLAHAVLAVLRKVEPEREYS
ncbi:MAG: butyrate kinase [Verrucomicrobia bacterium]|nr:butyrate kinase [Verrucomicrobiota bacterium]MBU4247026.1 butyrate kinase [Verrucomicrobiota bacterium]MBU4290324.1 butyrate kinase [Verrucomicrobiota bacterium]MBU4429117.1 butyrate kinase [Verrucomicrobiota bacterium]